MIKRLIISLFATLALMLQGGLPSEAEAKRLGGARSSGIQRDVPRTPATPATPQRADPRNSPASPAAQPSGWRRWAGPLAGLAAGIGLAALMSHLGIGAEFSGILLILALLAVAFLLFRRFSARNQGSAGAYRYATAAGPAAEVPLSVHNSGGSGGSAHIPPGFDVAGFERQAKVSFIRLQAANDAGNLDDIREFTSPEMFAELKLDLDARGGLQQKTDVVQLQVQLLDVSEEANRYVASVRFFGLLREDPQSGPSAFDETWHLTKPSDDSRGWVLAGIQQND